MQLVLMFSILITLAVALPSQETEVLHGVDVEGLFADDQYRETVFSCLLDKAPCGDNQKLKESLIILVLNKCANCNSQEKETYDLGMKLLHDKYGAVYNELMKKISGK